MTYNVRGRRYSGPIRTIHELGFMGKVTERRRTHPQIRSHRIDATLIDVLVPQQRAQLGATVAHAIAWIFTMRLTIRAPRQLSDGPKPAVVLSMRGTCTARLMTCWGVLSVHVHINEKRKPLRFAHPRPNILISV